VEPVEPVLPPVDPEPPELTPALVGGALPPPPQAARPSASSQTSDEACLAAVAERGDGGVEADGRDFEDDMEAVRCRRGRADVGGRSVGGASGGRGEADCLCTFRHAATAIK
jgi:hypothetical protein